MHVILGDFNAKIEKEAEYRQTIGDYRVHDAGNENRTKLIDFCNILQPAN